MLMFVASDVNEPLVSALNNNNNNSNSNNNSKHICIVP